MPLCMRETSELKQAEND